MKENVLLKSVGWKFLERCSVQIINLVVQIVLARLIAPKQFGLLSIIIVFYNLADLLVQKGFGSSLVRKKELTAEDVNSCFWVSLGIALLVFTVVCFSAPLIASFYQEESLILPLRLLSVNLLIAPLYCVLNSVYVHRMNFKGLFFRSLIATVLSGIVGIFGALQGWGIYALVAQMVVHQYVVSILLWIGSGITIASKVSKKAFWDVFSFGKNILISEFLLTLVENLRILIIGKKYSQEDLAYYDRGQVYPATLMRAIYDTLFSTLVPYYSKMQNDVVLLRERYFKTTYLALACIVPVFFGFASVAKEIILFLLTDKWIDSVPYMIIFCFYQALFPYQITSKATLYAFGVGKKVLTIEIVQSAFSIALLVVAMQFGVIYIALSLIAVRIIGILMYLHRASEMLGNLAGLLSTLKPLFAGGIMFAAVYFIDFSLQSVIAELFFNVLLGFVVYLLLMLLLDRNLLKLLLQKVKRRS